MSEQEVLINWTGEAPTNSDNSSSRVLIPEGEYKAELLTATLGDFKSFNNPKVKEKKIVLLFKILKSGKLDEEVELSMFLNPKIIKGNNRDGKSYSNSKLYDVLLNCKLLNEARGVEGEISSFEGIRRFLETQLSKGVLRVYVRTTKKDLPDAYSRVGDILELIRSEEKEKLVEEKLNAEKEVSSDGESVVVETVNH